MNILQKLRQLHGDIVNSGNGLKIVDAWTLAERLIGRVPADAGEVRRVFAEKDAAGLLALIDSAEAPPAPKQQGPAVDPDTQAAALRAFKKRLKVMRLSDESRLGGRYTSGGRQSGIDAIEPPEGFEPAVWKALARAGKLRDTGQGFYALPEGSEG